MRIPYYQVNAFTASLFGGNPAGVCLLQHWLPAQHLQAIAAENGHSETAFLLPGDQFYHLRWFTPRMEVDLCGHATLASAFVLFSELGHPEGTIRFQSRSGLLTATPRQGLIELDFPADPPQPWEGSKALIEALGATPRETYRARNIMAVFETEKDVAALSPSMELLAALDLLGVIVTAPSQESDFVSRYFAPRAGVPEDPVTGSAHCTLAAYWSERLGKQDLQARQISARGGELRCRHEGDRVFLGGQAVTYCRGELEFRP